MAKFFEILQITILTNATPKRLDSFFPKRV